MLTYLDLNLENNEINEVIGLNNLSLLNKLYLNLKSNLIEKIELNWSNLSELSYLDLNLENNLINEVVENGLSNLSLLSYLKLNLKDNYIDNYGYEG